MTPRATSRPAIGTEPHSQPGIAGIAEISKPAYPDASQFDRKSPYYDPKAQPERTDDGVDAIGLCERLTGRALPYGEGVAFWPIASMVKEAAGITDDDPASGFADGVSPPRFSTGYFWLRNRFGMLVETHSWKDYPTRVRITHNAIVDLIELAGYSDGGRGGVRLLKDLDTAIELVRPGTTTADFIAAALISTSLLTRPGGCGERITTRSHASFGANATFSPGRPFVKPLPSLPSVSMKMKTICTAKPPFIPQGSSSAELTDTSKSTLAPFCRTFSSVRSNEPGL